jgi:replication fork protection complex subunit Tof1/Swi1
LFKANDCFFFLLQVRSDKLSNLLEAEKKLKVLDNRKSTTRHSRFGTTVSLTTVRLTIVEKDISACWHLPPSQGSRRFNLHRQAAVAIDASKLIDANKKAKYKKARRDVCPSVPFMSEILPA